MVVTLCDAFLPFIEGISMISDSQQGGEAPEAGLPGVMPVGPDAPQAAGGPGGQAGQEPAGSPPPRRRVLDLGTWWPAVASVGLIAVGVIVVVLAITLRQPPRHFVDPPPATAGVLRRDYAAEASPQFRAGIAHLKSSFRASGAPPGSSFVAAIYSETGHLDPLTGAAPQVVFLGVTSGSNISNTSTQLPRLMLQATGGGQNAAERTAAGPGGGVAECASRGTGLAKTSICAWATNRTIGIMFSAGRDLSPAQLAVIMRAARPALEQ